MDRSVTIWPTLVHFKDKIMYMECRKQLANLEQFWYGVPARMHGDRYKDEIMRRMGLGDNRNKDGVQILNIFMLAVTNLHWINKACVCRHPIP